MSQLTKRIADLESCIGDHDAAKQIERIKQMRVTRADLEHIARGEWDRVQDAALRATPHRERWERAAPVIVTALDHDARSAPADEQAGERQDREERLEWAHSGRELNESKREHRDP
jgi:hypothetical protein